MKKPFTKILVEVNGVIINITDLPKDTYEYFLELTHALRLSYSIIKEKEKPKTNQK